MYDEMTRQQDHYWASLTYAQEEGRVEGRAEGMRLGIEQGIERGREEERVKYIRTMARLVNNGILTKQMACEELGITEQEFEAYLQDFLRGNDEIVNSLFKGDYIFSKISWGIEW